MFFNALLLCRASSPVLQAQERGGWVKQIEARPQAVFICAAVLLVVGLGERRLAQCVSHGSPACTSTATGCYCTALTCTLLGMDLCFTAVTLPVALLLSSTPVPDASSSPVAVAPSIPPLAPNPPLAPWWLWFPPPPPSVPPWQRLISPPPPPPPHRHRQPQCSPNCTIRPHLPHPHRHQCLGNSV